MWSLRERQGFPERDMGLCGRDWPPTVPDFPAPAGHQKLIDPETFRDFYTCWKEAEAEALEVTLPPAVAERLDRNECVYKLSSSVKTNRGVGRIALTQKRLFLLTDGRPGYVDIATFRDIEVDQREGTAWGCGSWSSTELAGSEVLPWASAGLPSPGGHVVSRPLVPHCSGDGRVSHCRPGHPPTPIPVVTPPGGNLLRPHPTLPGSQTRSVEIASLFFFGGGIEPHLATLGLLLALC